MDNGMDFGARITIPRVVKDCVANFGGHSLAPVPAAKYQAELHGGADDLGGSLETGLAKERA